MPTQIKKIRIIFIIYWFLLAYIIAALVWWFIALNRQNQQATVFKLQQVKATNKNYIQQVNTILKTQKIKKVQYIGEGLTFFLLIIAGALFVFNAVRRQLKTIQQQQNFMMALTHELKTPIAVAKLNLETLQKRKLEQAQQQHILQTALQEVNRLNTLCNNMLLTSQIEANSYSPIFTEIEISQLLNNCVQDFIARYSPRKISATIPAQLFTLGDELLLSLALNNLIDNAVKYSPKESTITIALSQQKNNIFVQIKDEGKGIAAEEKKKIFNKFYRVGNAATKAAKGTGLGLYLTQKIIQQHKGNIIIEDNFPTGCIFAIQLPVADPDI